MIGYRPYCPYTVNPDPETGAYNGPNVQYAKQLVRESGTLGDQVKVWAPPTSWIGQASPEYLAKVLTDIGYRAQVYRPDKTFANYVNHISEGHAEIGVIGDGTGTSDGGDVISNYVCGGPQYGRYCDPHVDALYRQGLAAGLSNPQAARDLWASLDQRLTNAAVIVPIWAETSYALVSTRVGNWSTNAGNGFLPDQLWVR
jgi:ABC-type transport system substrate-binding protein